MKLIIAPIECHLTDYSDVIGYLKMYTVKIYGMNVLINCIFIINIRNKENE